MKIISMDVMTTGRMVVAHPWHYHLSNLEYSDRVCVGILFQQWRESIMNDSYIYVITALLPLSTFMLIFQTNPYHALVIQGIVGAVAALVYAVFGAAVLVFIHYRGWL